MHQGDNAKKLLVLAQECKSLPGRTQVSTSTRTMKPCAPQKKGIWPRWPRGRIPQITINKALALQNQSTKPGKGSALGIPRNVSRLRATFCNDVLS